MLRGIALLDRRALVAALAALLGVAAGCSAPARPVATHIPGEPVVTLDGRATDLGHLVEGRVALVSFWATWCTACDRELDALNRLSDRTAARPDALVVGVAVGESTETVGAFVRRRGLRYTQVLDQDFRLADALGQRDVPATIVVDRAGRIVYRGEALDGASLAAFNETLAQH